MTDHSDPYDETSIEDQAWFEILTGRESKAVEPHTREEAEALRKTILHGHKSELENSQVAQDEIREARSLNHLLQRLTQEGLLEEPKPHAKPRLPMYSALTVAAMIVLGVFTLIPSTEEPLLPQTSLGFQEPPRLRSGMETKAIPINNPHHSHEIAQQLIQQLTELNIPYRLTPLDVENQPDWQLEIEIPFEPSEAVLTFLDGWRLKQTENGWIRIVPETP